MACSAWRKQPPNRRGSITWTINDMNSRGALPEWAKRQERAFRNWINNKLKGRSIVVENLFVDLQDGWVLYNLLEALTKQDLSVLGRVKPEVNKIKKIANMNVVWRYLNKTVKMVGIGPTDIVDGHQTLTLGLIWSIIAFFMGEDISGELGENVCDIKFRMLDWVGRCTKNYPDVEVKNLTESFTDGKAFLALLHSANPERCQYQPCSTPEESLGRAFQLAEDIYGVSPILDAKNKSCCTDEKSVMTYLAELFKALPDGISSSPTPPSLPPVRDGTLEAIDEENAPCGNSMTMTDKLRDFCRFQPKDHVGCAKKVYELMQDAGLQNIQQVTPTTLKDPSNTRAPFVIGEAPGAVGSPTILLYATYAIHDSDLSMWETDPFKAVLDHDRLIAKGAFADKANIIAFITAAGELTRLAALPAGRPLQYTVRVMIGSTMPVSNLHGDAPIAMADKMRDFLKANPKITGNPHYVIVSKPGGSALAPERWAVGIGCRGFGVLDMSVKVFNSSISGHLPESDMKKKTMPASLASFGGPLIDAGYILSTVLATIRDSDTGSISLPGIPEANVDQAFIDGLNDCQMSDDILRMASNYAMGMKFSKETIAAGTGSTKNASVVEQLTTMPGISIAKINMGSDNSTNAAGPLSAVFSPEASARLHICAPPGVSVLEIAKLLQEHFNQVAPLGSKLVFGELIYRDGWLSPYSDPLVQDLCGKNGLLDKCRLGAIVSSPGFDPIPCAFAEAIPLSKVITFGLNDSDACPSAPGESVRLEDMYGLMRTMLELFRRLDTMEVVANSPCNSPCNKPARGNAAALSAKQTCSVGLQKPNLTVSTVFEESTTHSRHSPVLTPTPAEPFSPLSLREKGARSVIDEEKDRKLHLALQRSNFTSTSSDSQINELRSNPPVYASKMETILESFHELTYNSPDNHTVQTIEGKHAVLEAIRDLRDTMPRAPLQYVNGMSFAAQEHADDLEKTGTLGHIGSDGSKAGERINRHGQFTNVAGEVISHHSHSGFGVVSQLLICDGEQSRANRKSILGKSFNVCGIGVVKNHPRHGHVWVINLAGGFGQSPLPYPTTVDSEGGVVASDFTRVLNSIPVEHILDQVGRAIENRLKVTLKYKPGGAKVSVHEQTGDINVTQCSWAA